MKTQIIYRIYYNTNGEIVSVSPTTEDLNLPFVVVDQAAGDIFMDGRCRIQDFRIDPSKDFPLVKKNFYVAPTGSNSGDSLISLKQIENDKTSIGMVVVSPDMVVIRIQTVDPLTIAQLQSIPTTEFCLYLTERDQPNHLIETFVAMKDHLVSQRLATFSRKSTDTNVSIFGSYLFTKFSLVIVE